MSTSTDRKPTITNQNTLTKEINRGKTHCNICKKMFGFFNREHVCKRCYRNIDSECYEPKDRNMYPDKYRKRTVFKNASIYLKDSGICHIWLT